MSKIKILKVFTNKKIILYIIIALIFFGILINMEYATDTYSVFTTGAREDAIHFMQSGRFVSAFVTIICKVLNLQSKTIYILSYFIALIALITSLCELDKIIEKFIREKKISSIITILIILNAFIIELFLFIEKGILIFSILMNVLAIKHLIRYFEERKRKELFIILLIMFIANGSYQGTVGLFFSISLVYIIRYSKNIKEFILNNLLVLGLYTIPALIDYGIAKIIFKGNRISGNKILSESLNKVIQGCKGMLNSYNILYKYTMLILIILIILILLYLIIKNKKKILINIFTLIYLLIGVIAIAILPQFMQDTASIWMVPRSTYSFASLPGILLLYLFMNFDISNYKNFINISNFLIIISIIYIVIEFISFTKVEVSRYKVNALDKQLTFEIINQINQYEKNTGNIIKRIAIYQDKNITYSYNDIFVTGDMNVRAYSADWATKAILEYYLGRKLEFIDSNSDISKKFKNQDWNIFDKDQLIFENDTLSLCCY